MFKAIFTLTLTVIFVSLLTGCGDGRGVSELIGAREAIIKVYPIVDDAEECITDVDIYTFSREVRIEADLDCLLDVEKSIVTPDDAETDTEAAEAEVDAETDAETETQAEAETSGN